MNLKKLKIITVIGIFILNFPIHFLYDWLPNSLFSLFFPVNESIWEHMKMIFTGFIFFAPIEYLLIKKYNIKVNNYILNLFITAIISIPIYLIMFLPIYNAIGENMPIIFILMIITITICEIINYYLNKLDNIKYSNLIGTILIVITYIIMGYLTYNPPKTGLFYDTHNKKYGINDYDI